jgi:hypothetical protein
MTDLRFTVFVLTHDLESGDAASFAMDLNDAGRAMLGGGGAGFGRVEGRWETPTKANPSAVMRLTGHWYDPDAGIVPAPEAEERGRALLQGLADEHNVPVDGLFFLIQI